MGPRAGAIKVRGWKQTAIRGASKWGGVAPQRWIPLASAAVAFILVGGVVLASPATAGRLVKGGFHQLPDGFKQAVPDSAQDALGRTIDQSVRFFSFGDPDRLVQSDLRLQTSQPAPREWAGDSTILVSWTDLGHDAIDYDVYLSPAGADFEAAKFVARTSDAQFQVPVQGEGEFIVWVRASADENGRPYAFGPFMVDATPPPMVTVEDRADPAGYRYTIRWAPVTDVSGIATYEVQRRLNGGAWEVAGLTSSSKLEEDQVGNGVYDYRVRAINGAGLEGDWSDPLRLTVKFPMQNPLQGAREYGVHANYTGFLRLWDLSDPSQYLAIDEIPTEIASQYLGPEPGIETANTTLQAIVADQVGGRQNTLEIAEALFRFLYDETDYDQAKLDEGSESTLQRAGETLDRGLGICGDLAVLYITFLRIAGVPARPVHGYLDNAQSGIGGFHMWVEVYVGPSDGPRPWLPVDVSGVTGSYEPEALFAYFGLFNPDYLALGNELNYDRHLDLQWNTWARFRWERASNEPTPIIQDHAVVDEYDAELGRLFFDVSTKRTQYVACDSPDPAKPNDPCPQEPSPPGFHTYYVAKGVSKKRIDYGADVNGGVPSCLLIEFRYPFADDLGNVVADQSVIFTAYENADTNASVQPLDDDGWVAFHDGTQQDTCTIL